MTEQDRTSPWRRLSRRTAYENAWVTVWHDEVVRPDGEPGIYGVVHYANLAVGVVAVDREDRLALVGQFRYTLDRYSWEIPEGGVPADEDPLDGARRELREETGLEAGRWVELGRADLSNSISDETAIFYLATDLTDGVASPDGTEELEVQWVPFDEALAMTYDGRITDALSVLSIQRVALARLRAAPAGAEATIDPVSSAPISAERGAVDG
jgi:8-oxo-dGTP pyrophosphatase MutT (NUDIX family)